MTFPPITYVADDARLYPDRVTMIGHLGRSGQTFHEIAEIGVAYGDFSLRLIDAFKPERFDAFDLFELHLSQTHWGENVSNVFGGGSHLDLYRQRMAGAGSRIEIYPGPTVETLPTMPDASWDLVYVDALHTYDGARHDGNHAIRMVRPGGLVIFNDYTMYDPLACAPYGVVQAVNEIVLGGGVQVIGFALQPQMFCDIVLRKNE